MFAIQLRHALAEAGINVIDSNPRIGLVWAGLILIFPDPVEPVKEPLYAAFHAAGLQSGTNHRANVPMADLPQDVPVIMVGQKRPLERIKASDGLRIIRPEK